jgi:hypothetical protein
LNTFILSPSSTWRKLGFALFSDSLSYREVLELNPKWNVMELPPVGAVMFKPSREVSQPGVNITPPLVGRPQPQEDSNYFPFNSESEYLESLSRYTTGAIQEIDRINGLTAESLNSLG